MALSLKLRSGDALPCPELQLDAPRIVVGRKAGCELQLPDPSVSGRHASVRQRGSDYILVDEGSDNGTFSGLSRLARQAPHTLSDGELLRFGRVWVEVRITPSSSTSETGASRELARTLVEHALERDGKPHGMSVCVNRAGAATAALRLPEPRKAYVVGSQKSAHLRIDDAALPRRALELRRQGDQLWVTLLSKDVAAAFEGRELAEGERTLWARGAVLTLGGAQLTFADPTAEMLDRLERDPVERLDPDEPIEPPDGENELADADREARAISYDSDPEDDTDGPAGNGVSERGRHTTQPAPPSIMRSQRRAPAASGNWTRADALVLVLALSVLGLSLWAIQWLAALSPA